MGGQMLQGGVGVATAFRHRARRGQLVSPPFAFSRATATPQSKSTSACESHETRSTDLLKPLPHRRLVAPLDSAKSVSPTPTGGLTASHDKLSRGIVGSCARALAWKSSMSLTARTTVHPTWDDLRPMDHSRRANAKILLAYFLHLHLSRVLGISPWLAQW
jgi:hypothetical protein